jgi:hypothetical protein
MRPAKHVFEEWLNAFEIMEPLFIRFPDMFAQPPVFLSVEIRECEILQFSRYVLDAEAMGEGSINLSRLKRDPLLLLRGQGIEGPHIVQPIGEFHEDDTQILADRKDELPKILCLSPQFFSSVFDMRKLCNAFYQEGDFFSKVFCERIGSNRGVFNNIMEQSRRDRTLIQFPLQEGLAGCSDMGKIRIAVFALLSRMRRFGEAVCSGDEPMRVASDVIPEGHRRKENLQKEKISDAFS